MKFKVSNKDFFEENADRGASIVFKDFIGVENISDICKYVALVYDYYSPMHEIPLPLRRPQVLRMLGYNDNKKIAQFDLKYSDYANKVKKIYKTLQHDIEHECYIGLITQLDVISKSMKSTSNMVDAEETMKIADKLVKIIKEKRALELMLKFRIEMQDSEKNEGRELSSIDEYHINNQKRLLND